MLRHRGVIHMLCEGWCGKGPHCEERKPTEELHHTQFPHDRGHGLEILGDFDESVEDPTALCIVFAESV